MRGVANGVPNGQVAVLVLHMIEATVFVEFLDSCFAVPCPY